MPDVVDEVKSFTTGGGIFDTVAETATDVRDAINGLASPGDLAVDGATLGIDALSVAMDPLRGLMSAGISWLIEHLDFLKEPLDALAGDPAAITQVAVTWGQDIKAEVGQTATDFSNAVREQTAAWQGNASEAYRKFAAGVQEQLDTLEPTAQSIAEALKETGMIVATVRGVIRGLIADVVTELVIAAASALATSWCTFGGSVAAFTGYAVARGAMTAGKIASKIADVVSTLASVLSRFSRLRGAVQALGSVARKFDDIAHNMGRAAGRSMPSARQFERAVDGTLSRETMSQVAQNAGEGARRGLREATKPLEFTEGSIKGSLNEAANADDNYRAEVEKQEEQAQQGS